MKLFGITGGIGMGKSTAGELLLERGYPVVDTDIIARAIVEPGKPALAEISRRFGADLIDENGFLRRAELARIVFNDTQARIDLEAILHPRIRDVWMAQAETWKNEARPIGFVIIPLLYETDAASFFSSVICVACNERTQGERLLARGWDELQIAQRLRAQMSVVKKMELSQFVIWTETTRAMHAAQWDHLLSRFIK